MKSTIRQANLCDLSDPLLAELIEEITARLQAGENIQIDSYREAYPAQAEILRELLPALHLLAGLDRTGTNRQALHSESAELAFGTLGDFQILREVGRGGMGIVYEAEQLSLGRRVALKVLPFAATMDPRHLQRFQNEARAAACLHHPNIVPVYGVGCERGVHYYAMQFIEGLTLAEVISHLRAWRRQPQEPDNQSAPMDETITQVPAQLPRGANATPLAKPRGANATPLAELQGANATPLREPRAANATPLPAFFSDSHKPNIEYYRNIARLGIQAAEALEHAHSLGIVHRDIKPGNLMLDARGQLWITDFGLARSTADRGLTVTGDVLGTLRYMSPEQALAKHGLVDYRTDIYALGVTLYELLTLRPAIVGEDRQEISRKIVSEDPKNLRCFDRSIPVDLETIVLKAMCKEPGDRYASARELAEDLERFIDDKAIMAKRSPFTQRLRKLARRHQSMVLAATSAILVVLIVLAWAVVDWTMRSAGTHQVVVQALTEADHWQERRRYPEALAAAKQAAGLAVGGTATEDLRKRTRLRQEDLELVTRLEEIHAARMNINDDRASWERWDKAIDEVFRNAGINLDRDSMSMASEQIRTSSVPVELATALDRWALFRRQLWGKSSSRWQYLFEIARQSDPDPFRCHLRDALSLTAAGRFRKALEELSSAENACQLPINSVLVLADGLDTAGMKDRAIELLLVAQQQHPSDFEINFLLGAHLLTANPVRAQEAVGFCTAAVALRPESAGSHCNLGVALTYVGRLDEARVHCQKAAELDPGFVAAHVALGNVHRDKGHLDEAVASYREAIRQDRACAAAYFNLGNTLLGQRRRDEAIESYQKAIQFKKDHVGAHVNLAQIMVDKGNPDEAIDLCRRAITIRQDYAMAHAGLGNALLAKGKVEEAISSLQDAVTYEPDRALHHNLLGKALERTGRVDDAIKSFQKAVQIDANYGEAYGALGAALFARGKLDEAIKALERAHQLRPTSGPTCLNFGVALASKGRLDEAIVVMKKAVKLQPKAWEYHVNLGMALANRGRESEAIAAYTEALGLKPNAHQTLNALSWLLATTADTHLRDPKRAVQLARQAVANVPQRGDYWNTLGVAQYRAGKWKEAIESLQRSIQLRQGGDSNDFFYRCMAHWQLGDKEEARKWFDQAVQWMEKNQPGDITLRRFRTEAETLLGIADKQKDQQGSYKRTRNER